MFYKDLPNDILYKINNYVKIDKLNHSNNEILKYLFNVFYKYNKNKIHFEDFIKYDVNIKLYCHSNIPYDFLIKKLLNVYNEEVDKYLNNKNKILSLNDVNKILTIEDINNEISNFIIKKNEIKLNNIYKFVKENINIIYMKINYYVNVIL
jgi:hypothetical protein